MLTLLSNFLKEKYNSKIISSNETEIIIDISKSFSNGELIVVKFVDNKLTFIHSLNGEEIRHQMYRKIIDIENDDIDFIIEDIKQIITSYFDKQITEFDYAIDNDKSKRVTILKQIARMKRYKILDMEEELKSFQESISEIMLEEVKRNGFENQQAVILKENHFNVCLQHNKKYYIDSMEPAFDQEKYHYDLKQFKPYIHFSLGRVQSDGYSYNPNLISQDNYRMENNSEDFEKITIVTKEKFAEKYEDYMSNIITYIINDEKEFPEIEEGTIYKHQVITYGSTFFSNHLNSYNRKLHEKYENKEFKVKEYLIEFSSNGKNYMYISLDTDKQFTMGKKKIKSLITMLNEGNPNIFELPKEYIKNSLKMEDPLKEESYPPKETRFSEFLYSKFENVVSQM